MQHQARRLKQRQSLLQPIARVDAIADERMAELGQVDADSVVPGLEAGLDHARGAEGLDGAACVIARWPWPGVTRSLALPRRPSPRSSTMRDSKVRLAVIAVDEGDVEALDACTRSCGGSASPRACSQRRSGRGLLARYGGRHRATGALGAGRDGRPGRSSPRGCRLARIVRHRRNPRRFSTTTRCGSSKTIALVVSSPRRCDAPRTDSMRRTANRARRVLIARR